MFYDKSSVSITYAGLEDNVRRTLAENIISHMSDYDAR